MQKIIFCILYGILGWLLYDAGIRDWHFIAILFIVLGIDFYSFITSSQYNKK